MNSLPNCAPIDSDFEIQAQHLEDFAAQLRRWAPRILNLPCGLDPADDDTDASLRSMIRFLDTASDSLHFCRASESHAGLCCRGEVYGAPQLFECIRMCSMLRNQSRLEHAIRYAIAVSFLVLSTTHSKSLCWVGVLRCVQILGLSHVLASV